MSNQPDSDDHPKSRRSERRSRKGKQQSIKRRVIRLVLIPGVVALVLWLVASGYLVVSGFYNREVASTVRKVSIPAVTALSSIQRERELSIVYLAQPSRGMSALIDQRRATDSQVSTLRATADSSLGLAPDSIKKKWSALASQLDEITAVRSTIDSGTADQQHVYDYYDNVLTAAASLFDTQARVVPDATAAQGGLTATDAFRVSDDMSLSGSIITGSLGAGYLGQGQFFQFVSLVESYHDQLITIAPNLQPGAAATYRQLTSSSAWKQLTSAENEVILEGPWQAGKPRTWTMTLTQWEALTTSVSDYLTRITISQADEVSAAALHTGNVQLLIALFGSLLALILAVGAIIWAVRQSRILVDRALATRLTQLGKDAAAVVDQRLPQMLDQLRSRERVDAAVELLSQDYGEDEIGQLAEVLNRSLQVAVGAAVDEAATRAAGVAMLMGVARRPQSPLQHGLQVIEDLQSRIGDEKLLAELFDVNHQLAQTRRFLENLIIVAGGQTGRRFNRPVPMRRVLLAASAETQQYQRVRLRQAADVDVIGNAVAGTTHLLAELIDNALGFSPPESTVWVSCTRATRGVVVEIEDAGLGMVPADLDRANDMLAHAPAPDIVALRDGSQVGLWVVAELARRLGIQVTLRSSAYGGLMAIVLLPDRLIATGFVTSHGDLTEPDAELSIVMSAADSTPSGPAVPLPAMTATARVESGPDTGSTPSPLLDWPLPDNPARSLSLQTEVGHPTADLEASIGLDVPASTGGTMSFYGATDLGGTTHYTRPTEPSGSNGLSSSTGLGSSTGLSDSTGLTGSAEPSSWSPSVSASASFVGATSPSGNGSRPPLPERKPQQHLAPELRAVGQAGWEAPEPIRSPEENQARFARYQQGWRAGLAENNADSPTQE